MGLKRYIPDSPGASRPGWMDDIEWSEYRMTPEYAAEVSYVPDEPYDCYDDYDYDYYEYEAMAHEEEMDAVQQEAEEIPLDELEEVAAILQAEIEHRRGEEMDLVDPEDLPGTREAEAYERHLQYESYPDPHPDGCYWCGSYNHMSTDCRERD